MPSPHYYEVRILCWADKAPLSLPVEGVHDWLAGKTAPLSLPVEGVHDWLAGKTARSSFQTDMTPVFFFSWFTSTCYKFTILANSSTIFASSLRNNTALGSTSVTHVLYVRTFWRLNTSMAFLMSWSNDNDSNFYRQGSFIIGRIFFSLNVNNSYTNFFKYWYVKMQDKKK